MKTPIWTPAPAEAPEAPDAMRYELSQTFHFEAAHTLRRSVDADSSRRIHGHTYQAEATVCGARDAATGMVIDLGEFRAAIGQVRDLLDHRFLDEVDGLGPATLENLCAFLFTTLSQRVPGLVRISVARPATGDRCVLNGPGAAAR